MVYIIRKKGTEFVKIGFTKSKQSLRGRLKTLQTSSPEKLVIEATMDGGRTKEKFLHYACIQRHVRGEWFELSADDVERLITRYGEFNPLQADVPRLPDLHSAKRRGKVMAKAMERCKLQRPIKAKKKKSYKPRGCRGKLNMGSQFRKLSDEISLKYNKSFGVYYCQNCDGTHLTTKLGHMPNHDPLIYVAHPPSGRMDDEAVEAWERWQYSDRESMS